MKYYRYTVQGIGVFQILKIKSRPAFDNLLTSKIYGWLPLPNISDEDWEESQSFFNEKGAKKYEKTILPEHSRHLSNIKKETLSLDENKIIYRDEYQVVCRI